MILFRLCGRILFGVVGRIDDVFFFSFDGIVDGGIDMKKLYFMLDKCLFYMLF